MLTQSFLSKLSDLAKSSRFLFFVTIFSFILVESSDCGTKLSFPKPAPIKSEQTLRRIYAKIVAADETKAFLETLLEEAWLEISQQETSAQVPPVKVGPGWPD